MKTQIIHAYHGKIIETRIIIDNETFLLVSTCRKHDKTIGSRAGIYKKTSENCNLLLNNESKQFKYVDHGFINRLTEKKLMEFHQAAIKIYNIN